MGGDLETRRAPLGAASTSHSPLSSCHSSSLPTGPSGTGSSWTADVGETGTGGDPKTDHSLSVGMARGTQEGGGDPKTDHSLFVGMACGMQEEGGDPKTDHSLCASAILVGVSPHSGGLATQTAITAPASPGLNPDLAISRGHDPVHPDGFPSSQLASDPVHFDGFPSSQLASDSVHFDGFPISAELSEDRDGFPRPGDSEYSDTVFLWDFHTGENSERVRESDSGVQIVSASRSPSELSAHQMGLPLAGTVRLKSEPIGVDPISTLAIEESVQLSISDRALLRKYKSSEQVQEISRQAETYKEIIAGVPRVDGHPPGPPLSIYDRMLLRKYSVPGMETTPSYSSTLASSPPVSLPAESMKKRRRFHQKGKFNKDVTRADPRNENSQDQEGSPCGFSSKVAEPPVRAGPIISPSAPSSELAHFTLLYYTLVQDGALPLGYLREFMSLETPARRAANRLQASAAAVSDSIASTALSALRRESEHRASIEKWIADQLVIAADVRPKRFRTKWQRAVYDGPTARKDAEASERDRWIQLLANLLRSTVTPMGKLIRENPSNIQLLGGGRRAGTLRSRVRSVQKFLGWLIASHGIRRQLTEYLQVRYSEPCVRGSLKLVHSSYIFLQEVAGIEDKLTDSAMYVVALKELMSQASPGQPPRQAPRFPTILLAAFEDMVLAGDKPVFLRVLSWWLLVQSWGTLRFDDHRGLLPRDFVVTSTGLRARLTRSKVSGSDKHLNFRTVIIHSSAYVQRRDWLAVGWKLLLGGAPHERDYLLPAPTNNFQGFKIKELKYSTAFAVQTHIISTASYRSVRLFEYSTGHYCTPHSGRNFMPSAAAVLGFSKAERDIIGGWSAEGSQLVRRCKLQ